MNIFKLLLLVFSITFLFSCNKDDDDLASSIRPVTVPQTELLTLENSTDAITVTWRPVMIDGFVSYKVYRYDSATNEFPNINIITNLGELRATIRNSNQISFKDIDLPYNSYINYVVVTEYRSFNSDFIQREVSANHLYYEREELVFKVLSVEKLDDSGIEVVWENDINDGFIEYEIFGAGTQGSSDFRLDIYKDEFSLFNIEDQNQNTYVNSNIYGEEYITFAVSKKINGVIIQSKNSVTIKNPSYIPFTPISIIKNPLQENQVILISDDGKILFYDTFSLSEVGNINLNRKVYNPTLGSYKGRQQFYIPSNEGKIFVYSLENYNLLEEIYVDKNSEIISVVTKEDYLIFLESDGLRYLNRETGVVEREGSFFIRPQTRLYNSKDNFFFRVDPRFDGQDESSIYKYDVIDGKLQFSLGIDNGSIKSGKVFEVSPDFSFLVSTNYGYHLNLNYNDLSEELMGNYGHETSWDGLNFIGIQEKYSDISITEDNKIYFSIKNLNRIVVHEVLDFRNIKQEYETLGEPLFFELLDNKIIVVNEGTSAGKSFVERIPYQ